MSKDKRKRNGTKIHLTSNQISTLARCEICNELGTREIKSPNGDRTIICDSLNCCSEAKRKLIKKYNEALFLKVPPLD